MKHFISKPAIALYAGVIVLILSLFGLAKPACNFIGGFNIETEICTEIQKPEEAEEASEVVDLNDG